MTSNNMYKLKNTETESEFVMRAQSPILVRENSSAKLLDAYWTSKKTKTDAGKDAVDSILVGFSVSPDSVKFEIDLTEAKLIEKSFTFSLLFLSEILKMIGDSFYFSDATFPVIEKAENNFEVSATDYPDPASMNIPFHFTVEMSDLLKNKLGLPVAKIAYAKQNLKVEIGPVDGSNEGTVTSMSRDDYLALSKHLKLQMGNLKMLPSGASAPPYLRQRRRAYKESAGQADPVEPPPTLPVEGEEVEEETETRPPEQQPDQPPPAAIVAEEEAAEAEPTEEEEAVAVESQVQDIELEPFETVKIPNPLVKPERSFAVWNDGVKGRCKTPQGFPSSYYLVLRQGECIDYFADKGFVSMLALMNDKKPSHSTGSYLVNNEWQKTLELEIYSDKLDLYRMPTTGDGKNSADDGFARITLLVKTIIPLYQN